MKQTAIQELIAELKVLMPSLYSINDCIHLAYAKLEKEKQQIIDAWIVEDNPLQKLKAEQYYNETFKSE